MSLLRIFSLLISFLFSVNIFALERNCITHAQCQDHVEESTGCFLVQSVYEKNKCEVKCYRIFTGSYCEKENNKVYGTCKIESYKTARGNEKDCSNTIPSSLLEDMFEI